MHKLSTPKSWGKDNIEVYKEQLRMQNINDITGLFYIIKMKPTKPKKLLPFQAK